MLLNHPIFSHYSFFLASYALSVLIVRLMIFINVTAEPLERSSHTRKTPSAGGVGPIVSFMVVTLFCYISGIAFNQMEFHAFLFLMTGVALLGLIGFIDDYKNVTYKTRLLCHALCAVLLLISPLCIEWPALEQNHVFWQQILTVFIIMGLINGANFIDGLDGLLSGSTLISLLFTAFMIPSSCDFLGIVYAILIGSILGFFLFNFPQARIFLGDVGSTFIGFMLAFLALVSQKYYVGDIHTAIMHKGFIFTLTPMAFLWFDVGITLLRRIFKGEQLAEAHRHHIIHILHDCGYSHVFVSSLYFSSVAIMGSLTLLCHFGYLTFIHFFMSYVVLQGTFCVWVYSQKCRHHKA